MRTGKTRVKIYETPKEWTCHIIASDNSWIGSLVLFTFTDGSYTNLQYNIDTIHHWHVYEMAKIAKRIFNKHQFKRVTPEQILKTINAEILF